MTTKSLDLTAKCRRNLLCNKFYLQKNLSFSFFCSSISNFILRKNFSSVSDSRYSFKSPRRIIPTSSFSLSESRQPTSPLNSLPNDSNNSSASPSLFFPESPKSSNFFPTASSPRSVINSCDYVLGISLHRYTAGYALLRSQDASPLKFGVIDLHDLSNLNEKAAEITGVLRVLKDHHDSIRKEQMIKEEEEVKQKNKANQEKEIRSKSKGEEKNLDKNVDNKIVGWKVGFQHNSRIPHAAKEAEKIMDMSKLLGILQFECQRIFETIPYDVNPKLARHFLSTFEDTKIDSRAALFDFARKKIKDFPILKRNRNDTISEYSYYMSDAWAVALYTQNEYLKDLYRFDSSSMQCISRKIESESSIRILRETILNTKNKSVANELQEVLKSRIKQLMDEKLTQLLRKNRKKLID